jgi:hypothetical protein
MESSDTITPDARNSFVDYWFLVCDGGIPSLILHLLILVAVAAAVFVALRHYSFWLLLVLSMVPFCCGSLCFWLAMRGLAR